MTKEEQRKQAAAQRCADMANAGTRRYTALTAEHFLGEPTPSQVVALNAILELDEQSRRIVKHFGSVCQFDFVVNARKHILPEPKPTPVERLADQLWGAEFSNLSEFRENLSYAADRLGLTVVEKSA